MFEKIAKDKDRKETTQFCNEVLKNFFDDKDTKKALQDYNNPSSDKFKILMQLKTKLITIANANTDSIQDQTIFDKIDFDFVLGEFVGVENLKVYIKEFAALEKAKEESIQNVRSKLAPIYTELEFNMMKKGIATVHQSEELKKQIKESIEMLKSIVEAQNLGKGKQQALTKELGFLAFHIVMSSVMPVIGTAVNTAVTQIVKNSLPNFPSDVQSDVSTALLGLQATTSSTVSIAIGETNTAIESIIGNLEFIVERVSGEDALQEYIEAESEEEHEIEKVEKAVSQESLKKLRRSRNELIEELSEGHLRIDSILDKMLQFSETCIDIAVHTTTKKSTLVNTVDMNIEEYKKELAKVSDIEDIGKVEKHFVRDKRKASDKLIEDTTDKLFLKNINSLIRSQTGSRTFALKGLTDWMTSAYNPEKDQLIEGVSGGSPILSKLSPMGKEIFMKFCLSPKSNPTENFYNVRHLFGQEAKMKFIEALPELQLLPAFRGKRIRLDKNIFGSTYVDPTAKYRFNNQIDSEKYRNQRHMTWISLKQIFEVIQENEANLFFQFERAEVDKVTKVLQALIKKDMMMYDEITKDHPLYSEKKPNIVSPIYLIFVLPQFSAMVNTPKVLESLAKNLPPEELEHFKKIGEMVMNDYRIPKTAGYARFSVWAKSEVKAHKEVMKKFDEQKRAHKDLEGFKTEVEVVGLDDPTPHKEQRSPTSIKEKYHISSKTMTEIVKNYEKRDKVAARSSTAMDTLSTSLNKLESDVNNSLRDIYLSKDLQKRYNPSPGFNNKLNFSNIQPSTTTFADFIQEIKKKNDLNEQLEAIKEEKNISYNDKLSLINYVKVSKKIGKEFRHKVHDEIIKLLDNPKDILTNFSQSQTLNTKDKNNMILINAEIDKLLESFKSQKPSIMLLSQLSKIEGWLNGIKASNDKIKEFMQNETYSDLVSLVEQSNNSESKKLLDEMRSSTIQAVKEHLLLLNNNLKAGKELPEKTLASELKTMKLEQLGAMQQILRNEVDSLQKLIEGPSQKKLKEGDVKKLESLSQKLEELKVQIAEVKGTHAIQSIIIKINEYRHKQENIQGVVKHAQDQSLLFH